MGKILLFILIFCCVITYSNAAKYNIAVSSTATAPEKTAAEVLKRYINKITGESVEIVKDTECNNPDILVGQSLKISKLLNSLDFSTLKKDEIILKSYGDNQLIVSGARPRGSIYAAYELLEHLGCRFWARDEYDIPKIKELDFRNLNIRYAPEIKIREVLSGNSSLLSSEFTVICRVNGALARSLNKKWGGREELFGWCHTFRRILPPAKYFKEHPEYYSLVNGKRTPGQLCLTNPEMRKVFIDNAKKMVIAHNINMISISQNDCNAGHDAMKGYCECPECKKLAKLEKGRQSGVLLDFVNEVAKELEKIKPGILCETLAYNYTTLPPVRTMPRDNVAIRLCSVWVNNGYPINSDENDSFRKNVKAWSKISKYLFIWQYATNYFDRLAPYPNLLNYADDYRFFRDNKVYNIFSQGDAKTGDIGDLIQLKYYVATHLMWNPDLDQRKMEKEFIEGYYGKDAAPFITEYINIIHSTLKEKSTAKKLLCDIDKGFYAKEAANSLKKHFAEYRKNPRQVINPYIFMYMTKTDLWLSDKILVKAYKKMQQAITASANNAKFFKRVSRSSINICYALLVRNSIKNNPGKYGFTTGDLQNIAKKMIKTAEESNVYPYSKAMVVEKIICKIRLLHLQEKSKPNFVKNIPKENVTVIGYYGFLSEGSSKYFSIIDDNLSRVNKKAWQMFNDPKCGISVYPVNLKQKERYHFYVRIRMEKKEKSIPKGKFLLAGVYSKSKDFRSQWKYPNAEDFIDGQYHYLDLGVYTGLYPDNGLFFAKPRKNPNVKAVVFDELIIVKE